ncbi:MAG: excisionase family DNA-binding protein [Methanosarcinaceae archaeon]|nr:excisionase family DNA-binding protein [Methanosarcinaceae archaeon]
MDLGQFLSIKQAAQYTALSVSYIQKLTGRRRIPFNKVGQRALYDRVLLDRWMALQAILPRD